MAAVSMHGSENAFGGMNSGLNRRLSPAFRTLASPLRQRHFDLETEDRRGPAPRPAETAEEKRQEGGSSPKGDEWEIVDKSPTFESVAEGKAELGGESWFVQEREQ
ncbi:hypothetical protein PRIC1_012310 [Phytophthora ramorum]